MAGLPGKKGGKAESENPIVDRPSPSSINNVVYNNNNHNSVSVRQRFLDV